MTGLSFSAAASSAMKSHSFQVVDGHAALIFFPPGDRGPKGPKHISQIHDAGEEDALGLQ